MASRKPIRLRPDDFAADGLPVPAQGTIATFGVEGLEWDPSTGAGVVAGNGINVASTTISIDTSVTVDKTTGQALSNKTLTAPVLNGPLTGTGVDTDSTFAANSDTVVASQKAVKTALALKANLSSPTGLALYGDGSDGSPTFDGSTTILGLAPSSSVYTLARDLFLASPTINNGVTLVTNGFRIFCSGTLTNNGTIQWNGTNAPSILVGGAAINNASSSINTTSSPGQAGANGGTGVGANGTSQGTANTLGGAGGAGGNGTPNAGGSGGAVTASGAGASTLRYAVPGLLGQCINGAQAILKTFGGAGGGAGGGDGSANGGAGGGGGGIVIVSASLIAGTGAIQARGGNGFNSAAGNTGGGGGGGGGVVVVVSSSVSSGAIAGQTIDANGGTFGTKTGTGVNGSPGSNGLVILLRN